jgi:hypothetical protein
VALSDNLIAYWPMDTPGAFSPDVVSGQHVLLVSGDPLTTTSGKVGDTTVFTAAGQDIFYAKHHADLPGDYSFSFSCWVYLTNKGATKDFISRWGASTQFIIGYVTGTDRFRFVVRNAANTANPIVYANNLGSPSLNTWYHLVCWYDDAAETINIQVNNGTVDSLSHTVGVNTSTDNVYIGGRAQIDSANANLDEIGYWKRTLTSDERVALYNGGAGIPYPFADETPVLHAPGGWSWYTNPRVLWHDDKLFLSSVESDGRLFAIERDDATGAANGRVLGSLTSDEHTGASILRRASDGKLLYASTGHDTSYLYLSVSSAADSVAGFAAATNLDGSLGGSIYSYPTLIQLVDEANDPIYLFWREGNNSSTYAFYYSVSTSDGATWAAGTRFVENGSGPSSWQRPYFIYAKNGGARIDFACTDGHPSTVATNSIYHFYYEGGNFYKSDGTLIGGTGDLPLTPADMTKVYDGTTVRGWTWDIAIDSSGYPVIVYATFPTAASDHRYRYARWTGSAWTDNEICTAGGPLYAAEPYYSGGVTVDKVDPSIVWASRNTGGQWEIYRYATGDNGATWTNTAITSGSSQVQARPYCPPGKSMRPVWWTGTYSSYTSYNLRLVIPDVPTGGGMGGIFDSGIFVSIVR